MTNIEIINQLLNGYYLEEKDLQTAKKIINYLNIELKDRKLKDRIIKQRG
tara:strand:- start:282 stop:431 length:150 start_codon:yes stop_codon:yes gene_type:complete